jgi:2-oxoglutarate dehydrogenase E2 component (dihydrolipoamide succinyltransferase)
MARRGLTVPFDSSNGGVFGSLFGTPIINLPQAAVLGKR